MDVFFYYLAKYWAYLIISAVTGAGGYFISQRRYKLKNQNSKQNALYEGVRSMLKHDINNLHEKCQYKGHCSVQDQEVMESMYVPYKNLGGNGVVDQIVEDLRKMPRH